MEEKFYSCYRTGLDGGRDIVRSFAGLYFVARVLLFLSNVLAGGLHNIILSENDPYFMRNIVLAITVLLITECMQTV